MRPFAYLDPGDALAAVRTVAAEPRAAYLAGGTNLVDHLKLGVATPDLLVDVTALTSDEIIDDGAGGLRIGAAVRNGELAADPRVRQRFPMLAQALLAGASGQLRNMATTGGNPLQRTRCVYFQDVTTPCNKREPGTGCSAIGGATRGHAILGASEHCIATHPSDMAVALAALDAEVRVLGSGGERTIPFADLHRLPGDTPDRDTNLEHGELVIAIDLPPLPMARRSRYRKVRDRASYAFALVSVAAALRLEGETIEEGRLALGGVAHKPWRDPAAEASLRGQPATSATFQRVADALLTGAQGFGHNTFKIELARRAVVRALGQAAGGAGLSHRRPEE
jgi:xanthine dehydrogenase YagS FAD-binding subunit